MSCTLLARREKLRSPAGNKFFPRSPPGVRGAVNGIDDGKKDRSAPPRRRPNASVIGCPLKRQDNTSGVRKCNWLRNVFGYWNFKCNI